MGRPAPSIPTLLGFMYLGKLLWDSNLAQNATTDRISEVKLGNAAPESGRECLSFRMLSTNTSFFPFRSSSTFEFWQKRDDSQDVRSRKIAVRRWALSRLTCQSLWWLFWTIWLTIGMRIPRVISVSGTRTNTGSTPGVLVICFDKFSRNSGKVQVFCF